MPVLIIIICLLTLIFASEAVLAASGDVVREQKAFLILGGFQQWAELKYQFSDHYSSNGNQGSASHGFQENYNANLNLNIVDPHILNTTLGFTAGWNQNLLSDSGKSTAFGSNFNYQYQFTGLGLDKSVTPFSITSYKASNIVNSPYAPSYTSSTTGNAVRVTIRNEFLPSKFSFTRYTLENSGGGFDSSTTSNNFDYSAAHQYKDLSSTDLSLSLSNSSGSFSGGSLQGSQAYLVALANTLHWGEAKKYSLSSSIQLQETKTQNVPQRNLNLGEMFQAQLGKALGMDLKYAHASSSTTDFSGEKQDTILNEGEVTLKHRLFESVTSRLSGKASSNELLGGIEYRYSVGGGINYRKKLPGANLLQVAVSGMHEVIDNRLGSSVLTVSNEFHPGVHQGDVITLPIPGGNLLRSVISVTSSNPIFTYSELSDYTIDFNLGQITIVRGGLIDTTGGGADIQISYTVSLNAVLKYANDSLSANCDLSLFDGKYSVGGAYSEQRMSLISGSAQNNLRDSNMKQVYFTGNTNPFNYRFAYTDIVTGVLGIRTLEGAGQYTKDFPLVTLLLHATERYTMYGATSTLAANTENAAEFSVVSIWNLQRMKLTTSANLLDSRGGTRGGTDFFFLRASSRMAFNKLAVALDGQTGWNFSGGSYRRDDSITLDITRYF